MKQSLSLAGTAASLLLVLIFWKTVSFPATLRPAGES